MSLKHIHLEQCMNRNWCFWSMEGLCNCMIENQNSCKAYADTDDNSILNKMELMLENRRSIINDASSTES